MQQLMLRPDQVEQREQAEAEIQEIKTELAQEEDSSKKESLKTELASREEKLETLLDGFQVGHSLVCPGAEAGMLRRDARISCPQYLTHTLRCDMAQHTSLHTMLITISNHMQAKCKEAHSRSGDHQIGFTCCLWHQPGPGNQYPCAATMMPVR